MDVLYRDRSLVVVDKPSGVAVHRGWAADRVNAMTLARDAAGEWVYPVHRLDRGTSGVLVFALSSEIAARIAEGFRDARVEKRYVALVRGVPPEQGTIDSPVPRADKSAERVPAVTHFRRLGVALDRFSLLELRPETGRLHQIRRHVKHISHPVMGDTRYGDGRENRRLRAEVGLHRLALHAASIAFSHPESGEPLRFAAPPPADLRDPLERLGLARELDDACR